MPELWLKYGQTSVVVDIKYENLLAHIYPTPPADYLAEQQIEDELSNMDVTDNTIIVVLSVSQAVLNLVDQIVSTCRPKKPCLCCFCFLRESFKDIKEFIAKTALPCTRGDRRFTIFSTSQIQECTLHLPS